MASLHESDHRPFNWGLLVMIGLVVVFWVIATTIVAEFI